MDRDYNAASCQTVDITVSFHKSIELEVKVLLKICNSEVLKMLRFELFANFLFCAINTLNMQKKTQYALSPRV